MQPCMFSDSGGSRGREAYRSVAGSSESMNGHEELVRWRGRQTGATCSTPLSRNSHNASSCFSSSSLRLGHRIKGLVSEEDLRHHSLDAGFCSGVHRNTGHRPSSAEFSRNTSSSNSPVSSKGSLDCLQGRSASLSSDDVIGLGHEGSRLSQISLIPRSSTLPCDTPSAQRLSQHPSSLRPSSPDSEMVTLEEFLQESNALSPPTVQTGIREDLLTDYFTRSARPAPLRDGAKTPTNYVMPTIKTTLPELEGRAPKPGHSVKPSVRHTETSMPPSQSQTLPNRGAGSRPSPLQQSSPHGGVGGSTSLSRTFSLASADLLHSNGPNSYRAEASSPNQSDVVRRSGAVTRERPLSARLPGSSPLPADPGHLSVDPRRLSLAPPRDELSLTSTPPLHSSSMSLQAEQDYVGSSSRASAVCSGAAQTRPPPHHGEVAMVTPVRAVSALRLNDLEEEPREPRQTESPLLKKADTANLSYSVKGQPTSKPASPDPNNDPQTVWYEYGCV